MGQWPGWGAASRLSRGRGGGPGTPALPCEGCPPPPPLLRLCRPALPSPFPAPPGGDTCPESGLGASLSPALYRSLRLSPAVLASPPRAAPPSFPGSSSPGLASKPPSSWGLGDSLCFPAGVPWHGTSCLAPASPPPGGSFRAGCGFAAFGLSGDSRAWESCFLAIKHGSSWRFILSCVPSCKHGRMAAGATALFWKHGQVLAVNPPASS